MRRRMPVVCAWVLGLVLIAAVSTAPAATAKSKGKSDKTATTKSAPAETVLVWVGGEAITTATVRARLDELPEQVRGNFTSPEGRQRLLDRVVEERVWLLTADKKGVPDRPELKRQLEQQKRDLIIRTYVSEVMSGNTAPSDSETQAYYDAHLADYKVPATVTMSHIQLKTQADAKRVLGLARAKGADWNALVAKWSVDSLTRKTNGSLGMVTREGVFGGLGTEPALAESAMALGTAGAIGGPYKTAKGWHVIRVENYKSESTRTFDQVKGQIVRQLSSKRSQEYYQAQLHDAEQALGLKADSAAIKGYVTVHKTPRDLFNEAQSAGAPAARIDQYQKLLAQYPDSDVSPQAQFMIGFIQSEELKDYDAAEKSFRTLLARYPKSELASSAQWMVDNMRTKDAPAFMNLEGDSAKGATGAKKGPSNKP
ncbi:MAG: peptidyl-prolyl cis-trans isomerase [Candidatus Eisenbacteria bacterium]